MLVDISLPDSNSPKYTLTCKNDSNVPWAFYMYQKLPDQPNEIYSLAWMASPAKIAPKEEIVFKWSKDYNFMWANTGVLTSGITYLTSGSMACSPNGRNATAFDIVNEVPQLSRPITEGEEGSLIIKDGTQFARNIFSTGIGMSGQGTFLQQALVNTKQIYTSDSTYYIAAASNMQMGRVLRNTVNQTKKITFDDKVYDMTATLSYNNFWTVK